MRKSIVLHLILNLNPTLNRNRLFQRGHPRLRSSRGCVPEGFEATVGGAADNNGDPVAFDVQLTMVSVGGDWVHYQGMFSGVDEFTLVFSFTTPDSNDPDSAVYLDGVSITQVPEPGSLALVGLALAGIAVLRRRKA